MVPFIEIRESLEVTVPRDELGRPPAAMKAAMVVGATGSELKQEAEPFGGAPA